MCTWCKGVGYVEQPSLRDGRERTNIAACPKCMDVAKYAKELRRRYGGQGETQQEKINRLILRNSAPLEAV